MMSILLAIIAGAFIVISRIINSNLANKIGIFEGTFFNFLTGLLFSFLFFMFSSESIKSIISPSLNIPFAAFLGGLVGVIVVAISNLITPKIPVFYFTLFLFVGQLLTGMLIDYFALNTLSTGKLIGGILVLLGLSYNLYLDKKVLV